MKAFRTIAAGIAIIAGAACVVAWLGAFLLLRSLDDGSLARGVASAALNSPTVTATIAGELEAHALAALRDQGIDLASVGLGDALGPLMTEVAESEAFRDAVLGQIDNVNAQVVAELGETGREPGPLVVSVNATVAVNDALRDVPLIGGSLPSVTVAPVQVPVMSADAMDKAREGYGRLEFARDWLGWIGLVFLAGGFLISTRPAYVAGKFLVAVGVFALATALVLTVATPDRLVSLVPGGDGVARALGDAIAEVRVDGLARLMAVGGAAALVVGAIAIGVTRAIAHRND